MRENLCRTVSLTFWLVISSLADSEIQTGDDVVSDKVPILRHTESTDDVKIFEGLTLGQRNQFQRIVEEFTDIFTDVSKRT